MYNNQEIIDFIRDQFNEKKEIHLHEPNFFGNEKRYLNEVIDTGYVSSIGEYVSKFERLLSEKTNSKHAIATVNGTSALQLALNVIGVKKGDEVITQALTFIATANSIIYNGAAPIFLDVDIDTMGLSASSVEFFLNEHGDLRDGVCFNKKTNRKIAACVPMHTFGFPVHLDELIRICDKWNIPVVEDAAESLGSYYNGRSTGTFGKLGIFSFNGNKIITSGGGGAIITNDFNLSKKAKHLSKTAKINHPYEYIHDGIGFNFRMPNLNAALGYGQLENLDLFLKKKRSLACKYSLFFDKKGIKFRKELPNTVANYWLMCIELESKIERDLFLKVSNKKMIRTRPIWQLIFRSNVYSKFQRDSQKNAKFLEERIVNIPSNV